MRPSKILDRRAFENAIASVAATGGSTNAVLHFLALARERGIKLEIDEFDVISRRTPIIADMKPGGRYTAVDLHLAGGARLVAKSLIDGKLVDGGALTVSGKTLARRSGARRRNRGPGGRGARGKGVQVDRGAW